MGIYLHKSVKVGPLRFNLSGSGLGISTGIRGLRVGVGPRGHYVRVGAHGVSYRASIPRHHLPPRPRRTAPRREDAAGQPDLTPITSVSIEQLVDSTAAEMVDEIRKKAGL